MSAARHVLITGGSSGMGRALAHQLARPGVVLHVSGRDGERLAESAARCRARGATVETRRLDVRDAVGMASWIGGLPRLDLAIANAGTAAGNIFTGPETENDTAAIFATNLDGVLNTVHPALRRMRAQAPDARGMRGRIAATASTAAFSVVPTAPAYCASKAAVDSWMVGRAAAAAREGIQLTSVCPGYVRSRLTATNDFAMPGLMDADEAARRILRGIGRGKIRVVFPWWMGLASRVGGNLPAGMTARLLGARCRYLPSEAALAPAGA